MKIFCAHVSLHSIKKRVIGFSHQCWGAVDVPALQCIDLCNYNTMENTAMTAGQQSFRLQQVSTNTSAASCGYRRGRKKKKKKKNAHL